MAEPTKAELEELKGLGVQPLEVTDELINSIAEEEGFHSSGVDPVGIPTVGFGHKLTPDELESRTVKIGAKLVPLEDLTEFQDVAKELLRQDVNKAANRVKKQFEGAPLNNNKFNALTSLSFNVGDISKVAPKLTHAVLTGNDEEAAKQFLDITRAGGKELPGLVKRRQRESQLFSTPLPAPQPQSLLGQQIADVPLPEPGQAQPAADPQLLDVGQQLEEPTFATPENLQILEEQTAPPLLAELALTPEEQAELQGLGIPVANRETVTDSGLTILPTPQEQAEIDAALGGSSFAPPPVPPDAEVPEPEGGFVSGLTQGLRQNLTGLSVAALEGGRKRVAEVALEEAQFRNVPEGLGYVTGQLLDPVGAAASLTVGGAAVKVGQLTKALTQTAVRKSAQEAAKAVERQILRNAVANAIKTGSVEATEAASKAVAKQLARKESLKVALLRSAGEAAGAVGTRAALDPSATPSDLALEGGIGTALGFGLRGAGRLVSKFREPKNIKKTIDLLAKQERVDFAFKAAEDAKKAVQRRIAKLTKANGGIKPEATGLDPDAIFRETLTERLGPNFKLEKTAVLGRNVTSPLKLASRIDEAVGTQTFDSVAQLVQNANVKDAITLDVGKNLTGIKNKLNKLGRSNADITDLLEHVNRDGVFDPAANAAREAYVGRLPSPQELETLAEFRQAFNSIRELSPSTASRNFFVPRYFKPKEPVKGERVRKQFESVEEALRASFEQKRVKQRFDPKLHQDDIQVIIDRYAAEQGKSLAYRQPIERLSKDIQRLRFLGRNQDAEAMANLVADVLNLRRPEVAQLFFADQQLSNASARLGQMISGSGVEEELADKLLQKSNQIMSEALVFKSPLSTLKNMLQLEVVGPGEVGARYLQIARNPFSKARKIANEHIDIMKTPTLDFSDLDVQVKNDGNIVMKAFEFARAPFKLAFNKADTQNRKRAFAAAYEQWEDLVPQGQIANVLDGLLPAEKALVVKTLNDKGEEAAKIVYGLTRSRRINFAYTIADKPQVLRDKPMRFIPFTTWGRNVASRMMQDVGERNLGKLANRFVAPFLAVEALRAMGVEISGLNPASSAVGIVSPEFNPILSSVPQVANEALEVAQDPGNFDVSKSPTLSLIPGAASVRAAAKAQDAMDDVGPLGALGIKSPDKILENESLGERAFRDIFDPYRLLKKRK